MSTVKRISTEMIKLTVTGIQPFALTPPIDGGEYMSRWPVPTTLLDAVW